MGILDIKELRERLGIRACEVARAIGMDKGNYSAWESGRKEYKRKGVDYISSASSYLRSRAYMMRKRLVDL